MPETPNINSYRSRFNQFTLSDLIDNSYRIDDPYRSVITDAHKKVSAYFSDDAYRSTLTVTKKNNIENQLLNIITQFEQILSYKNSNITFLMQNIEGISNNIQSYLEDLDMRFYTPYQQYLLQNRGDISNLIGNINQAKLEGENLTSQIRQTLRNAELLAGEGAATDLADHYQLLANGMTKKEYDQLRSRRIERNSMNDFLFALALSAGVSLILILGADELIELYKTIVKGGVKNALILIGIFILLLGPSAPFVYKWFGKLRPGGYERAATLWFLAAIVSVLITAAYAWLLVHQLGGNLGWEQLIPKLVTLLAPAYLIRFSVQNYKANKHLAVLNIHKATVTRVAKLFADQIAVSIESLKRDELITRASIVDKAASVVFDPGETGFITTKEGAGADSIFEGFPLSSKLGS
jgi:hypothetical protein